jgi:hypothetical protein
MPANIYAFRLTDKYVGPDSNPILFHRYRRRERGIIWKEKPI